MREKVETRVNELRIEEFQLVQEIGNLEKTLTNKRATLISTRGGILELDLALKDEEE